MPRRSAVSRSGSLASGTRGPSYANVANPPAVAGLGDHLEALFERRLGIDPVQVVEGDGVRAQPAQALLDLRAQGVRAPLARPVAALGRDDTAVGDGRERLADGRL